MTPGQRGKNTESSFLLFSPPSRIRSRGMKFVYILVGFTRECLNRQTAAGLPSQQLINNSASLRSVCCFCRVLSVAKQFVWAWGADEKRADYCAQRNTWFIARKVWKCNRANLTKRLYLNLPSLSICFLNGKTSEVSVSFLRSLNSNDKDFTLETNFFDCTCHLVHVCLAPLTVLFQGYTQDVWALGFKATQEHWTLICHNQIQEKQDF